MTARSLALPPPDVGGQIKRWVLAAAIVCATHAALMASYLLMPQAEPEGLATSPAVILDFAPVPVAPASQQDIAPGPEMVEAQATPKPPEQAEPEVVEPTPLTEAPAEVMLPKPEPKAEEKKPEQEPEKQKIETQAVQENTPAPQTTAAPRSEQETAAVPKAPSPGSDALRTKMASWRELVVLRLQQNKRYPASARARDQKGTVTLSFTVDRNGHVLDRKIVRSSGVAALDEEVLAMIQRSLLPAFPSAMTQPSITLIVPVNFDFTKQ